MLKSMYRIVYQIVTTVSQYVSYHEQMYRPTPSGRPRASSEPNPASQAELQCRHLIPVLNAWTGRA